MRVTNPRRTPIASRTIEEHVARPAGAPRHPAARSRPLDRGRVPAADRTAAASSTVGPALIVKTDLLGLMRREIAQTDTQTLWVHPRVAALGPLPVGFAKDLEGPTSDASPAGDVAFHALREYELGDDHRHIHWMSSARTGQLMVRHYVDNRRPNITVVVDTEIDSYRSERQFDLAIEVAASLGVSSMLHGQPVAVWLDRDVVTGQNRPAGAQRHPRPPDAGRRAPPAPTSPTPRCTPCAPSRAPRRSSSSPATCRPIASCAWPPSPAARRASSSCGRGRAGDRLPGVAAGRQGHRRRRARRVPGRLVEGDVVMRPPAVRSGADAERRDAVDDRPAPGASGATSPSPWRSSRRCRSSPASASAARCRAGASSRAAAIGALGASAIVLVAHWRRLLLGESVALSALGFVVLGGVAVGGLPTPGAYGDVRPRASSTGGPTCCRAPRRPTSPSSCGPCRSPSPGSPAAIGGEIARHSRRPGLPGDRPDPRPRPEPAVHDRGALARPRPGRRHPRRHAAADRRRPAPRPPRRRHRHRRVRRRARMATQPDPPDARRRRRRRRGRRRPDRRPPPARSPRPTSASTCAATRCRRSTRSPCPARSPRSRRR